MALIKQMKLFESWSYLAILQACYLVLRPVTGAGSVIIPPDPNMYMNMYIVYKISNNGKGDVVKCNFTTSPLPYSVNQNRKSLRLSCSISLKFSSTTARAFSFGTLRTSLSISLSPIAFVSGDA